MMSATAVRLIRHATTSSSSSLPTFVVQITTSCPRKTPPITTSVARWLSTAPLTSESSHHDNDDGASEDDNVITQTLNDETTSSSSSPSSSSSSLNSPSTPATHTNTSFAATAAANAEYQTGTIKWIDFEKRCGAIALDRRYYNDKNDAATTNINDATGNNTGDNTPPAPSSQPPATKPSPKRNLFFHFFDIVPREEIYLLSKAEEIRPMLSRDMRVKFRVYDRDDRRRRKQSDDNASVGDDGDSSSTSSSKSDGNDVVTTNKAKEYGGFDIKYEDGGLIPVLTLDSALSIIRKEKAKLGHTVYEALENLEDPEEMARSIQSNYESCNNVVTWASRQIVSPDKAKANTKAALGDTVYTLLEKAERGDVENNFNLKEEVDKAFSFCRRRLNEIDEVLSYGNDGGGRGEKRAEEKETWYGA